MKNYDDDDLLIRGTPIREYNPKLSDESCAIIARILDENRADRARRLLAEKTGRENNAQSGGAA